MMIAAFIGNAIRLAYRLAFCPSRLDIRSIVLPHFRKRDFCRGSTRPGSGRYERDVPILDAAGGHHGVVLFHDAPPAKA